MSIGGAWALVERAEDAPLPLAARAALDAPVVETARSAEGSRAEDAGLPEGVDPPSIVVRLRGVPAGARVYLDGAEIELDDGAVRVDRDGREHRVTVRHDGRAWSVRHVAGEDAEHHVRLRAPRRSGAPVTPPGSDDGIFRDLDY